MKLSNKIVILYFIFYYSFLLFYSNYLNIADFEILTLQNDSLFSVFQNYIFNLFGKSNITLRVPSIILSIFSLFFYYKISEKYLKKRGDIYFAIIIFSLIPGFLFASILFNKAIYIIFFTLLFLYTFLYYRFISYILLLFYTLIDDSFISLYLGILFFSIYKKDFKFIIYSLLLLMINANYFNYKIGGHPQGYFVDVLLIYFSIFSPFIFFYFIYSLLKLAKTPNLLWFISIWGLIFSILLSFRQRILIENFAPFVIISIIFMIKIFLKEYRIRLKIFRQPYKILFIFLLCNLLFFDMLVLSSKLFFNKKIVSQFNYSKQIADRLKLNSIDKIQCNNKIFCEKLYFYGIKKGKRFFVYYDKNRQKVSISHNQKEIFQFYVSNLNKK